MDGDPVSSGDAKTALLWSDDKGGMQWPRINADEMLGGRSQVTVGSIVLPY